MTDPGEDGVPCESDLCIRSRQRTTACACDPSASAHSGRSNTFKKTGHGAIPDTGMAAVPLCVYFHVCFVPGSRNSRSDAVYGYSLPLSRLIQGRFGCRHGSKLPNEAEVGMPIHVENGPTSRSMRQPANRIHMLVSTVSVSSLSLVHRFYPSRQARLDPTSSKTSRHEFVRRVRNRLLDGRTTIVRESERPGRMPYPGKMSSACNSPLGARNQKRRSAEFRKQRDNLDMRVSQSPPNGRSLRKPVHRAECVDRPFPHQQPRSSKANSQPLGVGESSKKECQTSGFRLRLHTTGLALYIVVPVVSKTFSYHDTYISPTWLKG